MKQIQDAYVVAATRTPIGRSHRGFFRNTRPDDLLATTLRAALAAVPTLDPAAIEDIVCGCAIPEAQQGLNVARIAAVLAGLRDTSPAALAETTTRNAVAALPRLAEFILPAGTRAASLAHVCRTVARRAERAVVALGIEETVNDALRHYLNRLSDLLFVLARVLNRMEGSGGVGDDVYWKSERMARSEAAS